MIHWNSEFTWDDLYGAPDVLPEIFMMFYEAIQERFREEPPYLQQFISIYGHRFYPSWFFRVDIAPTETLFSSYINVMPEPREGPLYIAGSIYGVMTNGLTWVLQPDGITRKWKPYFLDRGWPYIQQQIDELAQVYPKNDPDVFASLSSRGLLWGIVNVSFADWLWFPWNQENMTYIEESTADPPIPAPGTLGQVAESDPPPPWPPITDDNPQGGWYRDYPLEISSMNDPGEDGQIARFVISLSNYYSQTATGPISYVGPDITPKDEYHLAGKMMIYDADGDGWREVIPDDEVDGLLEQTIITDKRGRMRAGDILSPRLLNQMRDCLNLLTAINVHSFYGIYYPVFTGFVNGYYGRCSLGNILNPDDTRWGVFSDCRYPNRNIRVYTFKRDASMVMQPYTVQDTTIDATGFFTIITPPTGIPYYNSNAYSGAAVEYGVEGGFKYTKLNNATFPQYEYLPDPFGGLLG